MPLQLENAARAACKPLGRVLDEETLDERVQPGSAPLLARLLGIHRAALAVEDELAERVPVDRAVVRLFVLHLGCHVALRAADRLTPLRLRVEARGHAHVNDAHVAGVVDEHIRRLEVAVHDVLRVDVREAARKLGRQEPYLVHFDGPPLVGIEVLREGVIGEVLKDHVQVLHGLKRVRDARDVRVRARYQALELARAVQLPPARARCEDVLIEHLKGVADSTVLFANLEHLALVALTEDL
mmetsp:Transcript_11524/g.29508  ORF Transcript_11524/g.29508 Transcript_11524/m.29508 type:complete len:241 (+) Transcript_11524:459-1181(+)